MREGIPHSLPPHWKLWKKFHPPQLSSESVLLGFCSGWVCLPAGVQTPCSFQDSQVAPASCTVYEPMRSFSMSPCGAREPLHLIRWAPTFILCTQPQRLICLDTAPSGFSWLLPSFFRGERSEFYFLHFLSWGNFLAWLIEGHTFFRAALLHPTPIGSVAHGCFKKLLYSWWLKTTQMYHLTVLEVRSLNGVSGN